MLVALCLSAFGLLVLFERHVERRVQAELQIHLDQLIAGLERDAEGELVLARPPADPRFNQPLSGPPLANRHRVGRDDFALTLAVGRCVVAACQADDRRHRAPASPDGPVRILSSSRSSGISRCPAWLGGSEIRAVVALDTGDIRAATRAFAGDLVPFLALIGALLIAAAWTQVTVGLRPLSTIRDRLAAIRSGASRRLGAAFPDEVRPLATEIDALLSARELQIEKAKARATDLAHGLKTPLQVLAGDIARLKAKGETTMAEKHRRGRGGDAPQRRAGTRPRPHRRRFRKRARRRRQCGQAGGRGRAAYPRRHSASTGWWTCRRTLEARIDPDDLAEALGNLVENAARHACQTVEITGHDGAGTAMIAISDDGPGIPEEQLD